ncbi:hypothetical protein BDW71DRAFT_213635 [Aspergillus fruticulosus]
MMSPARAQLTCSACTRHFSRREHLARHLRSHENQRPFQCGSCGKGFNRCDLLNRHRKMSCSTVTRDWLKQPHSRGRSACESCAKAKLRCSSSVPCSRCQNKGISCVRKLTKASTDPSEADDVFPENPARFRSALIHGQEYQQDTTDGKMIADLSVSSAPQFPVIRALPQGLRMDFLDLSTFPANALAIDPRNISEPNSAMLAQMRADTLVHDSLIEAEESTGAGLRSPSDSWHTYRNTAWDATDGPQGLPRSIRNLLSLEDILDMEDYGQVARIRPEQVDELASFMAMNAHQQAPASSPHCRGLLKGPKIINAFVQLYVEHFHPTFPLLHRATFNVLQLTPLLLLATTTIGGRFSKIPQAQENIDHSIQIPFAQAAVLNQIQIAYHGSRQLALKAQFQRAMLVTVCRGINSKIRHEDTLCDFSDGTSFRDDVVFRWLDRELARRATHGIWLLDCQFTLNFGVQPMMTLEDLEPCLPCHETIWDLDIASLSEKLKNQDDGMRKARLKDALNTSKLADIIASQNLGLFARSITMMAMFYRGGLDVLLVSEPLAAGPLAITSGPLVPAAHRAQWRAAASEAITCLSKNTNTWCDSESAQPMKPYHHISILLNVPLTPMCDFIGWMSAKNCVLQARESLCAWLRADTQHARGTVMHAIALFCLIRKRKSAAHGENHHLFGRSDIPVCTVDWDGQVDLKVQEMWIAAPGHPPLRLSGVGNLAEPNGLHRILVETHRILLSDQMWGISRIFAGVLEGLISRGTAMGVA